MLRPYQLISLAFHVLSVRTSHCCHPGQWGKFPSSPDRLFNCNSAAVHEPPPDKRALAGPRITDGKLECGEGPPPPPRLALPAVLSMAGMLTEAECIEPSMPTAGSGGIGLPLLPYIPATGDMFRPHFRKVLKIWLTICP